MSNGPVLAAVDLTDLPGARAILREALFQTEARRLPLMAMTVVPEAFAGLDWRYVIRGGRPTITAGERRELVRHTLERLNEIVAEEIPEDIEAETVAVIGVVYEQVLETAGEIGAALLVIAASEFGTDGTEFGPNAASIARHAACTVVVIR